MFFQASKNSLAINIVTRKFSIHIIVTRDFFLSDYVVKDSRWRDSLRSVLSID